MCIIVDTALDPAMYSQQALTYSWCVAFIRRTMDPAEATAFFIPYDLGFDAAIKKDSAKIRPHGCPHAETVIGLLEDNVYFKRNFGYDHFLVQGLNQAMGNFNTRFATC